jgi:hypothetical protein
VVDLGEMSAFHWSFCYDNDRPSQPNFELLV